MQSTDNAEYDDCAENEDCTYDDWKKAFDADAEMQAEFMRETIVGKVDE